MAVCWRQAAGTNVRRWRPVYLNCIPAKSSTPRRRPNWQRSWRMFFAAPDGHDPKLAHRASTYFQALSVDFDSSPAALAIASVISSLTSPSKAAGTGNPQAAASRAGDAAFGGFGAVVGAGIGWGIGGPIGAGIGAVVGGAVGVCISEG